jgi:GTP-binding protein
MEPIVTIVGRPNVGKSTFFNRATGTRNAIVDDTPGVTRDRHYGNVRWDGLRFTLVDTGGFIEGDPDHFSPLIRAQVLQAVEEADAVVLLLDGKGGVSPFDRDMVDLLRGAAKPVLFAVNKIDGPEQEGRLGEFYALGVPQLHPLSAAHGYGMGELLDALVKALSAVPPEAVPESPEEAIRVAVVGRPNVGKSSLINRILGRERLLVSPVAGTTRDAIDTMCEIGAQRYLLVDTAGIRRKGRVSQRVEKFSVVRALRSLDRCDVALVVLDAAEGLTGQDLAIAGYALERGCGCVLLFNKWDLTAAGRTADPDRLLAQLHRQTGFLPFAPTLTVSALTGLRIGKIFSVVKAVYEQYSHRLSTGTVNRIVERAVLRTPPPRVRGRRLKFFYTTQVGVKPPTFVGFVNYPEAVHFSYRRYLLNQIRSESGLDKTPLRLLLRKRTAKERHARARRRTERR